MDVDTEQVLHSLAKFHHAITETKNQASEVEIYYDQLMLTNNYLTKFNPTTDEIVYHSTPPHYKMFVAPLDLYDLPVFFIKQINAIIN